MNLPSLFIIRPDHERLSLLVSAAPRSSAAAEKLRGELARATVIDPAAAPAGLITMNARVVTEDLRSGEFESYTLVYPDQADIASGRLSILAPIGTALIGFRTDDIVEWPTPGGLRRLRIRDVTPAGITV